MATEPYPFLLYSTSKQWMWASKSAHQNIILQPVGWSRSRIDYRVRCCMFTM